MNNTDNQKYKYLTYGMPVGLLIGVVFATLVDFGRIGLYGGIGLLLGVTVGTALDHQRKGK